MSEKEYKELAAKLAYGLDKAREKLLREKAALDLPVVYADANGVIREVPGKQAYSEYLAQKAATRPQ